MMLLALGLASVAVTAAVILYFSSISQSADSTNADTITRIFTARVSDNKFLYARWASSVFNISVCTENNGVVTKGAELVITTAGSINGGMSSYGGIEVVVAGTKFLTYDNKGVVYLLTVVGDTVSKTTQLTLGSATDGNPANIALLTPTLAVYLKRNSVSPYAITLVPVNINGDVLTSGTPYVCTWPGINTSRLYRLNNSQVLVSGTGMTPTTTRISLYNVSSTTITAVHDYTYPTIGLEPELAVLSDTRFFAGFGSSTQLIASMYNVVGNTITKASSTYTYPSPVYIRYGAMLLTPTQVIVCTTIPTTYIPRLLIFDIALNDTITLKIDTVASGTDYRPATFMHTLVKLTDTKWVLLHGTSTGMAFKVLTFS